ncbi:hypothetical protein [Chryseobacterium sp. VD8]|uniref:hypothetical protein n=1 Tax=Chryseobacterium sp. VD8 TaxID=3081254 RepID=UPI00301A968C
MITLNFDWNNKEELKENLLKWAYDESLILLEDDEDVIFLIMNGWESLFRTYLMKNVPKEAL